MTSEDNGFWREREPCWEMMDCSAIIWKKCQAYLDRNKPCWEHRQTACADIFPGFHDCQGCKVFRRYSLEARLEQAW